MTGGHGTDVKRWGDVPSTVGGGLFCVGSFRDGSVLSLNHCTITENIAFVGGGGAVHGDLFSEAWIVNSILWGNSPDEIAECESNLSYSDIRGGWPGDGNIDIEPGLLSVGRYHHLLAPGSPCIDAGDPWADDGIFDWHSRWPVWYPSGARSDMGAFGGPSNGLWLPRGGG